MDDREFVLRLIHDFNPDVAGDEVFMQYLTEHMDTYFGDHFLNDLRNSIRWKIEECVEHAWEEYAFITDTDHPVYLDAQKKKIHFGKYVLPANCYREELTQKETDEITLRYKRIWKKLGYGKIRYPLLEDWRPLSVWKEHYSEQLLKKMEKDLEAGTEEEALRLYSLYARRAGLMEIERCYPDKIRQILSVSNPVSNQMDSEGERTADLTILLKNGSECSVRAGFDRLGRNHSLHALSPSGFPMFTDHDVELIESAVFDGEVK